MMVSFNRKTLLLLLPLFFTQLLLAQAPERKVTRCSSVSRSAAVHNIAVDAENNKWVASGTSVFQVLGTDLSNPLNLEPGQKSALGYRGGNADVRWTPEILQMVLNAQPEVTTAWYDERNDWLWLGTKGDGLIQLKTKPTLKVVEKFTSGNSKLKSNTITAIFQDRRGRYWIGTDNGMIAGTPDKWKSELDGYHVLRVREFGPDVWVLADGEFWAVRGGEKWEAVNVKEKALEGEAEDFDLSPNGNLWILSRMVSRYDLDTDEFDVFSGAEYYTSEYGRCIAADLEGAVWVGTEDKGLYLIDKASSLIVNCMIDKDLGCNSATPDAALSVKVEGGKAPYTYAWSAAGMQGANPQNLGIGTYTVTVTDSNGKTKAAKAKIDDPRITLSVQARQAESGPAKKDGSAEVVVKGGAPDYTFKWDNGETANPAKKLTGGQHSVTVTDKKGCTATASVTIDQKLAALSATVEETTPIPCAGGNTILKVTVSGGKEPYQYEWSNPKLDGTQPTGVTAGAYTLTVVDATGGKTTTSITLVQPAALSAVASVQAPASTGNSDGKAAASPRGGSSPYTYRWDNGETEDVATQLKPGPHSVTVTDANGCTITARVEVAESILPLTAEIEETAQVNCNGGQSALKVSIKGGKSPYEFAWNNAALSGYQPSGVKAGAYTVTVTDAAGGKTTAAFVVKQPDPLTATATVKAAASTGNPDGKASAQGKGGTIPYQFRWDNGETTDLAAQLKPGPHTLTVSDVFGCSATTTVDIPENILPLNASIEEKSKITCFGGQTGLKVSVNGGKGPFQFQWSNPAIRGELPPNIGAGNYQVTVTDAAGTTTVATIDVKQPDPVLATATAQGAASTGNADGKAMVQIKGGTGPYLYKWDNDETADVATRLSPGVHNVTVTDANGCFGTTNVTITENILPLTVRIEEIQKIACNGGQGALKVNVSGGKEPFQYQWANGALQGATPANVQAGDYTLIVSDAVGGRTSTAFRMRQPDILAAFASVQAPSNVGKTDGKARVQARGGSGPYQYRWDNGETGESAIQLGPGNHTLTVTDVNGCAISVPVAISENILPLAVQIEATEKINCNGDKSALKTVISGGKGPFEYLWSNPALQGEQPAGVPAGTYQLTISDAVGTKATASITIRQPDALTATGNVQAPASTGNTDGKALIQTKGGTGALSYRWDNGETTATAVKLGPGAHGFTVTDANGCAATGTANISENILPLEVQVEKTRDIKCAGGTSGLLVRVTGGKPPYQYKWDNPAWTGPEISNARAATYAVLVTDAQGTTQTAVAILSQPDSLLLETSRVVGATTERSSDGKATVKATGGTPPLNIVWDNGETTATAAKLGLGPHSVSVTDANGCVATHPVTIKQRILPELNAAMLKNGQTIRMEQLRFEADSSSLTPDALPTLDELFDFMMENGDVVIEIGGHTNSTPPDEFCDRLSTARAKSAADYLAEKGIDPKRVVYKGYGKRQPVASNATAEGRRMNQRVEIKILTLKRQ